jgi:hypothetical protein
MDDDGDDTEYEDNDEYDAPDERPEVRLFIVMM